MSDGTANHDVESTGGLVAPKLAGGATLPFPPTPSASVAGRTLQESTYAQRVTPSRLHAKMSPLEIKSNFGSHFECQ